MKRWILGFVVVALLLLVGVFFLGMTMQERITQNYQATHLVDLVSAKSRSEQPVPWQDAVAAAPISVPVSRAEPAPPPNFSPPPSSEPVLPPSLPYLTPEYADDSPADVRLAQNSAPDSSWAAVPSDNVAAPSIVAQHRVRFSSAGPAVARNAPPTVVELADNMSYLIDVSHKDKSQIRKIQSPRIHGGKQVIVSDVDFVFSNQHLPDFRVFAEDVDVTSVDDEFELTCKGKVVVVANQSMLRGEGLELKDGVFKVAKAEVVTADAVIKAGDSEFEFAVGGISVNKLAKHEEDAAENQEETPPVLGAGLPALPAGLPESLPSLPTVE